MKYRDLTNAIENKVPGTGRGTKEQHRWAEIDGKRVLRVTYPKVHSRSDIPSGTCESIRKQLKLDSHQFARFVDCKLSSSDYEALLRAWLASQS